VGYFGLRHRLWPTADGEVGDCGKGPFLDGNQLINEGFSMGNAALAIQRCQRYPKILLTYPKLVDKNAKIFLPIGNH
jgi:hypothetical protein